MNDLSKNKGSISKCEKLIIKNKASYSKQELEQANHLFKQCNIQSFQSSDSSSQSDGAFDEEETDLLNEIKDKVGYTEKPK